MEIRDPIHGSISIEKNEVPLIEHPFFQRLRNIKQLGFSEYAFPGATHTRYIHSIGVMSICHRIYDKLFADQSISMQDSLRLKKTLAIAGLLHDIGHAPLSHSTERAMPQVQELHLPLLYDKKFDHRQATHEDYTLKAITDSSFTETLVPLERELGLSRYAIADLILGETNQPEYFTVKGTNYFPLFSRLISSELDADRLDYLLRDSFFCGVSYGNYDLDWIIDNLLIHKQDDQAFLGLFEKAIPTFNDFLLGRYHMFLMVYFHYRAVCLEQMLQKYLENSSQEYQLPASIEEYQKHDDYLLMNVLRKSSDQWAKKISLNRIPAKIFDVYNPSPQQMEIFDSLIEWLQEKQIDYILCSSKNRLSKYQSSSSKNHPFKVISRPSYYSQVKVKNIEDVTDLFNKYSATHEVIRLHCDIDHLTSENRTKLQTIVKEL